MKYYMIRWMESDATANCFPYIFKTKEDAQRYIDEATYFPDEYDVIEVEPFKDYD